MTVTLKRVGLEQYAPGGKARLKLLNIGGPGAGKTRFASYWPDPVWADCEGGLGSVADRGIVAGNIETSDDMLDFLKNMKVESNKPDHLRQFQTIVIDTLDAFQRKVKDEWLQKNPNAQTFRGFDAWGYLDSKMQMLLTRLLNLDMNVIVNVHYKDKTIREGVGDTASERVEHVLQLSGDVKDSAFNDFDLVGWMGTFWAPNADGEREQRRGLTFTPTPEKPFLKDRLHFTPKFFEVTFSENDYFGLLKPLEARIAEVEAEAGLGGEVVREIEATADFRPEPGSVITPGRATGGALAPQEKRELPLNKRDKPELQQMARFMALDFKGNTLKSELVTLIEDAGGLEAYNLKQLASKAAAAKAVEPATEDLGPDSAVAETSETAPASEPVEPVAEPVEESVPECGEPSGVDGLEPCGFDKGHPNPTHSWTRAKEAIVPADAVSTPVETVQTEVGTVNVTTGEIKAEDLTVVPEPTAESVAEALGAAIVEDIVVDLSGYDGDTMCGHTSPALCGRDLNAPEENQSYVKLSSIKYLTKLCNEHFLACKATGKSGPELRVAGVIA